MYGKSKELKMGMGKIAGRYLEVSKEWRLSVLLYADDLVLCGLLEKDLKVKVGCFVHACKMYVK